MTNPRLFVLGLALVGGASGACSPSGGRLPPRDAGNDGVISSGGTLRIEPATVLLTADLAGTGTNATVKVFEKASPDAAEVDVTATAHLALTDPSLASILGSTITALHGGKSILTATTDDGATGAGMVQVKLLGQALAPGLDPTIPTQLMMATEDPTLATKPVLEYPLDGAIVPSNMPPMEAQWKKAGLSTAYRVHLVGDTLDVSLYTSALDFIADAPTWKKIIGSAAGTDTSWTIDGLQGSTFHRSATTKVVVAEDRIDDSSVYYWEVTSSTIKLLDFASSKVQSLPVVGSAWAPGSSSTCVGCHSVSRDGKRIGYSTTTNVQFGLGTLAVGATNTSFDAKIEPGTKVPSGLAYTFGAFNPNEATSVPAYLVSRGSVNTTTPNVAGHVTFALIDPDTGTTVPSNLPTWSTSLPSGIGPDILQADWSPSGLLVFAAYNSEMPNPDPGGTPQKAYVRLLADETVATSIVEATITYDATAHSFTFGTPKVIVQVPPGATSLDTIQTNSLPAISPDDAFVAFIRSDGWWSIKTPSSPANATARVALVRRSDGQVVELLNSGGPVGSDTTWPQWAPTLGKKYAWLAFSTKKPYGHRGTGAVKNMWVTAIDLTSAQTGTADPSAVPFWIPGQTPTSGSLNPRWTKTAIPIQ